MTSPQSDALQQAFKGWFKALYMERGFVSSEEELNEAFHAGAALAKTLLPAPPTTQRAEPCQRLGCRFDVAQSLLDRAKERGELSEAERASVVNDTAASRNEKTAPNTFFSGLRVP